MDRILAGFLERQEAEGAALADSSDLLQLRAIRRGDGPVQHFIARFNCLSFVKQADGKVVKANQFDIGLFFSDDYLRQASTYQVLTFLHPKNFYHPNLRFPHFCLGEQFFRPGTPLVEVLFQCHSVLTYRRWASHRGLDPDACQWAINHQHLFPSDPRPLKRRALHVELELTAATGGKS